MSRVSTLLTFLLFAHLAASSSFSSEPAMLRLGQPIQRTMASGGRHDYHLELPRDRHVLLEVDQLGVDVVVRVFGPDGEQLVVVDQLGERGAETVSLATRDSGDYRIEVTPSGESAETGAYNLEVLRLEAVAETPAGKIEQMLSRWDRPGSPGAALAVVRDGKLVYAGGFGHANLEHSIPMTPHTVVDAASLAKQFTGMAIAMLVQQGKLSLEDDYRKHLPEMPDYGPVITLDHLVHHTSGIRDWPRLLALAGADMGDVIPFERILTLARNQRQLNFPPGDELDYSNTNYNLLAEIVSRVTGKPFPEWTEENLFAPLGMTSTDFHRDIEAVVPHRATGYYRGEDGRFKRSSNNLAAYGSSSLYTTVEDLARWAANFDTQEVGGPEVMELMHRPTELNDGTRTDYGFGLSLGAHGGVRTVGHGGAWASLRTALVRLPAQRLTVIVLSNAAWLDCEGVAGRVAALYLDEDRVAAEPATAAPEGAPEGRSEQETVARPAFTVDREILDSYAGYYRKENGELSQVQRQDDRLIASSPRNPPIVLLPVSEDVFAIPQIGARMLFQRDDQRVVHGAVFSVGEHRIRFERLEPFVPDDKMLAQYVLDRRILEA